MVIDHSDNIKCIRNKMINERAIFMAVKEKEVERAKKLRKDLSDNYKQQEKEAREQFRFKQEEKKKQIEQKIKVKLNAKYFYRKMNPIIFKKVNRRCLKREEECNWYYIFHITQYNLAHLC